MSEGLLTQPIHSWRIVLQSYARREVMVIGLLGFAAGLPLLLVFSTLSTWLGEVGIAKSAIGFFSWLGITHSCKVLWTPIVDRLQLPLLHHLGRRRSWMLLAQCCIILALVGMAFTDPQASLTRMALFAVLAALASATQDIVIDAFRIESADPEYQGIMATMYVYGYRIALLVAGAGTLYIAEFQSWQAAYLAMAALMGVGIVTVLLAREPAAVAPTDTAPKARVVAFLDRSQHLPAWYRNLTAWLIDAIVCPFVDFFTRYKGVALTILLLVGLYRICDITMGIMANPFYLDTGFSKSEIASISKVFGLFMTLGGVALGGLLIVRYGLLRPLLLGATLTAATNLLFTLLAVSGPSIWLLAITIGADNISGGLATAASIAYLSSLTSQQYTATQYAIFFTVLTLPGKFLGGFSGMVVESIGYMWFFISTAIAGLPAILLICWMMRYAKMNWGAAVPR